jgi:uncharacterized protein YecA (UPF0149 family)
LIATNSPGLKNYYREAVGIGEMQRIIIMPTHQRDRPLNDAECARLNAVLSRFGSEYAMNNLEEIDGFFAALICSPDVAKPSEYLPEIWGREMADDEAFADRQELQDFLGLLFRHWNSCRTVFKS